MIQNGALSLALWMAKERIVVLKKDSLNNTTAATMSKEHLPKMDLPREFHGKPSKDIEDFLLNCDKYIAARAPKFKSAAAAPLMVLGRLRELAALTMCPWKSQVTQHP